MMIRKKKMLKGNLFDAINKVLAENNAKMTNKIEKVVQKSIKHIVKKYHLQTEK